MAYNKRTGVTTLLIIVKGICAIYTKFGAAITAWVQGSSLTGEQKAVVLAWLGAATSVCALIHSIGDD